jgi:hypothetical protein
VALIVTLPLGLLSAYGAWLFVEKRFFPVSVKPIQVQVFSDTDTSTEYAIYGQGIVLAGGLAVAVFTACVTNQVSANLPSTVDNSSDTRLL